MSELKRADLALVEAGLAPTRSQATLLIEEGVVFHQNKPVKKSAEKVSINSLEVKKAVLYVSRGAHKIEGALAHFNVDPRDMIVADIGASTGGFTDYVLNTKFAKKVYAIDVGHDQLAKKLREDSRVINLEGINIKNGHTLPEEVDLAVVDLSFISLKLVMAAIFSLVKKGGKVIALVKPQFEVGREGLDKNGIVKNAELRLETVKNLKEWCEENHFHVIDQCVSPIAGKTGNVEYFFYLQK